MRPEEAQHQQSYVSQYVPIDFDRYTKQLDTAEKQYAETDVTNNALSNMLKVDPITKATAYDTEVQFKDKEQADELVAETQAKIDKVLEPFKTSTGRVDLGRAGVKEALNQIGNDLIKNPTYMGIKARKDQLTTLLEKEGKVDKANRQYSNPYADAIAAMGGSGVLNELGGINNFSPGGELEKYDRADALLKWGDKIKKEGWIDYAPDGNGMIVTRGNSGVNDEKIFKSYKSFISEDPTYTSHVKESARRNVANAFKGTPDQLKAVNDEALVNKEIQRIKQADMQSMMDTYRMNDPSLSLQDDKVWENLNSGANAAGAIVEIGDTKIGNILVNQDDPTDYASYKTSFDNTNNQIANLESKINQTRAKYTNKAQAEIDLAPALQQLSSLREDHRYLKALGESQMDNVSTDVNFLYDKFKKENPTLKVSKEEFKSGGNTLSVADIILGPYFGTIGRSKNRKDMSTVDITIQEFMAKNGNEVQKIKEKVVANYNKSKGENSLIHTVPLKDESKNYVNKVGSYLNNILTPSSLETINAIEYDASGNKITEEDQKVATLLRNGYHINKEASATIRSGAGREQILFRVTKPAWEEGGVKHPTEDRMISLELTGKNKTSFRKAISQNMHYQDQIAGESVAPEIKESARKLASRYDAADLMDEVAKRNEGNTTYGFPYGNGISSPKITVTKKFNDNSVQGPEWWVQPATGGTPYIARSPQDIAEYYNMLVMEMYKKKR
jgi:hypothetical protein